MIILYGGNGFLGRHISIVASFMGLEHVIVGRSLDEVFFRKESPKAQLISEKCFSGEEGTSLINKSSSIIYLASASGPTAHVQQPWQEADINLLPAFKLFNRVATINNAAKIVLISSGGTVYGESGIYNKHRETDRLSPISPYGLGKLFIEESLMYVGRTKKQRYSILRLSNPVGKWHYSHKQGLIMAVVRAIEVSEELNIYGDAIRDYVDADDVARIVIKVGLDRDFSDGIWNVGSGVGTSTMEVVSSVSNIMGKTANFNFLPAREIDVKSSILCIEKIKKDFGSFADTPLEQSIENVVKNFLIMNKVN